MGKLKQLHIDCYPGKCLANQWETCYQQPEDESVDEPDYEPSVDEEPGRIDLDGDYNPQFDEDRE